MSAQAVQVYQPLSGIGDALLGLTAVCGLKAQHPDRTVVYCCDHRAAHWVMLFQGFDALASSPLTGMETFDLHDALTRELAGARARSWAQCYASWCGAEKPRMPWVRPLQASRYQEHVVLCPLTAGWPRREWSIDKWQTLERYLLDLGLRVVIVGHDMSRLHGFASPLLSGAPREIAATIGGAALVVGVDTGLMHLAGALGVPAIVIAGPTLGREIYGSWPSIVAIEGDTLPCHGCYGVGIPPECESYCAALNGTTPARVLQLVNDLLSRPRKWPSRRLEVGQRIDRVTGEIEPWYTEPALDAISQWPLSDKVVLEWGGGHSTLWWARRCKSVVTIDISAQWCDWIRRSAAEARMDNVRVLHRPLEDSWTEYPLAPEGVTPNIVVIDGARRLECLESALRLPRPLTLIIDNWRQRGCFQSSEAEQWLSGFPGCTYVDTDILEDRYPWQTAIWEIA